MTEPVDESAVVAEIAKAMEAEGLSASEPMAQTIAGRIAQVQNAGTGYFPEFRLGGPLPLDDLRARLQACVEAGVTSYRDGALELKFDPDSRKGAKQTGGEITSF